MRLTKLILNEIGRIQYCYVTCIDYDGGEINRKVSLTELIALSNDNLLMGIKVLEDDNILISKESLANVVFNFEYCSSFHAEDIELAEVKAQKYINTLTQANGRIHNSYKYLLVDEVTLRVKHLDDVEKLLNLGFKLNPNRTLTAKAYIVHTIIKRNENIRMLFNALGIRIAKINVIDELIYQHPSNKSVGTKVIELNDYMNNIENWINKAKMLGIYNDYIIENNYVLTKYIGDSKNPIIPPVRFIGSGCFNNRITRELRLPDSVRCVRYSPFFNLEYLKLGENTLEFSIDSIGSSRIKEIDSRNIIISFVVPRYTSKAKINLVIISKETSISGLYDCEDCEITLVNGLK